MRGDTRSSLASRQSRLNTRQSKLRPQHSSGMGNNDQNMNGTHRAMGCFVGCTGILGPIMLIIGIVLLALPNDRSSLVDDYNLAGSLYSPTDVFNFSMDGGQIDNHPTRTRFVNVQPEGSDADVQMYESFFASAFIPIGELPPYQSTVIFRFQLSTVIPFTRVVTPIKLSTVVTSCNDKHGCSVDEMTAQCVSQYGDQAQYDGSGCVSIGGCGVCRFPLYLQSYCAVVTPIVPLPPENQNYAESDGYRSCLYPFTDADTQQVYSQTKPQTIEFKVMKKSDPFIAMQRITKGSMNFGASAVGMRQAGTSLAIIGGVGIGLMIVVACILCRSVRRSRKTGFETDSDDEIDEPINNNNARGGANNGGNANSKYSQRTFADNETMRTTSGYGAGFLAQEGGRSGGSGAAKKASASESDNTAATSSNSRVGGYQPPTTATGGGGGAKYREGAGNHSGDSSISMRTTEPSSVGGGATLNTRPVALASYGEPNDIHAAANNTTTTSATLSPPMRSSDHSKGVVVGSYNKPRLPSRPPEAYGFSSIGGVGGNNYSNNTNISNASVAGGSNSDQQQQHTAVNVGSFQPPRPVSSFEVPLRFSKNTNNNGASSTTPAGRRTGSVYGDHHNHYANNNNNGGGSQRNFVIPKSGNLREAD